MATYTESRTIGWQANQYRRLRRNRILSLACTHVFSKNFRYNTLRNVCVRQFSIGIIAFQIQFAMQRNLLCTNRNASLAMHQKISQIIKGIEHQQRQVTRGSRIHHHTTDRHKLDAGTSLYSAVPTLKTARHPRHSVLPMTSDTFKYCRHEEPVKRCSIRNIRDTRRERDV